MTKPDAETEITKAIRHAVEHTAPGWSLLIDRLVSDDSRIVYSIKIVSPSELVCRHCGQWKPEKKDS